jgi:hypothetical protein
MKRISMASVIASGSGSLLLASTVVLATSFAVATPPPEPSSGGPEYGGGSKMGPLFDNRGLDLPVGAPVYDPTPKEVKPVTNKKPVQGQPDDDPRDEPPPTFYGEEIDADVDSIIYVIDNSGSMTIAVEPFMDETGNVTRGNRLDRAKAELRRSIAGLSERFFFNVMFYDECVMMCWTEKQRATAANKQAAIGWLNAVQPDGWTNTGLGVATALGDKSNKAVVLLSDGAPNFLDLIRTSNTQAARVDCFGIGIKADPDATGFMQTVASQNNGSYRSID